MHLRPILALAGLLLAAAAPLSAAAPSARPNIVILLADDAGWGDYGLDRKSVV